MITIYQPQIIQTTSLIGGGIEERSRLSAQIDVDGEMKELWFEVDREYEKYLCYERADAFLVGLLYYAIINKHDIDIASHCDSPVTEELLYNLTQYLIPTLSNAWGVYNPQIYANHTSEDIENHGGVGSGLSCGIDSFYALFNHLSQACGPKVTHLLVNNPCYHWRSQKENNDESALYTRVTKVAKELELPIIRTDSNLRDEFRYYMQSTAITATVMALQKLWKTYLFASSYVFSDFKIIEYYGERYDLLPTTFLSTRGLRFYSEGGAVGRFHKTMHLSDYPPAHKYLHVCDMSFSENCGKCTKCRRTILTLDIIGKLEKFASVFPIDYFRQNLDEYLTWLAKEFLKNNESRMIFAKEIEFELLKGKHAKRYLEIRENLKPEMLKNADLYFSGNFTVSLSGRCPQCSNEVKYHSSILINAKNEPCTICEKTLCLNPILYCDLNKLNNGVTNQLKKQKIAIWAVTPANINALIKNIPGLMSENVFLLNTDKSIISSLSNESKKIYDPHQTIDNEKISTVIVPNSPEIFSKIKQQCETEFPQVKRVLHITELLTE